MFIIVYAVLYLVQILRSLLAKFNILVPHWLFSYMPKPGAMLSPRGSLLVIIPLRAGVYIKGYVKNKERRDTFVLYHVVLHAIVLSA